MFEGSRKQLRHPSLEKKRNVLRGKPIALGVGVLNCESGYLFSNIC